METDNADPLGEAVRDGLFSLALAAVAGLGAWTFLPLMPGGEWAMIIHGVVTLVIAGIVFSIAWFITVLLTMKEMGL